VAAEAAVGAQVAAVVDQQAEVVGPEAPAVVDQGAALVGAVPAGPEAAVVAQAVAVPAEVEMVPQQAAAIAGRAGAAPPRWAPEALREMRGLERTRSAAISWLLWARSPSANPRRLSE
jgi:hypothetical protein